MLIFVICIILSLTSHLNYLLQLLHKFSSVENWCRDGMCENGMSCFGAPDCNIQDIINAQLEAEKEANGEPDETESSNKGPLMAEDDPKRSNFCGSECVLINYTCFVVPSL